MLGLVGLVAWSTVDSHQTLPAASVVAAQTPTLTGPEKDATKMAPFYEERRLVNASLTSFALGTPYPTSPPYTYIVPTSRPLPTLVAGGPLGDCADADRDFLYVGCWVERINNEYLIIEAGAFIEAGAIKLDLSQGMLRVYTMTVETAEYQDHSLKQLYTTPSKSGKVRIVGVNWPLMTLISVDTDPPVTFGFDLATRQWVSPPPQATVYAQMTRRAEWVERVRTEVALTPTAPLATRTLTGPERDATKEVHLRGPEEDIQTRAAHATAFALGTPYPPTTPFTLPTPPTPIPPTLGINGNCAQGNHRFEYGRPGCWAGLIDGEYVFVTAGARKSDLSQGLIWVYTSTLDLQTYGPDELYSTPIRGGVVTPEHVSWPLLTLVAEDNSRSVFNLSTRQWVSPASSLGPYPTEMPWPSHPTEHGKIYDKSLEDNPIGKMLYSVNYWIGSLDDQRLGVYAGHISTNPVQGLILVRESIVENGEPKYKFTEYLTLSQVGALRIISEIGGQLTLKAADGSLLYFDLTTRQWVNR